jgi:D-apionolactonase
MTMNAERLRLLHGSAAPITEMRTLRAGPVTVLLDGIDLRYLRIGDTELVRRVYAAVRDVDWDTVPAAVSGLEVEQADASFRVEFDARHARREIDFTWHGTIAGDESGRVEVVFDGRAEDVLPYNRIGICVHHPWRETKGARFRAGTPDGELEGTFPDEIGVQAFVDGAYRALFPAYDRLEVELPAGGRLLLEFEGDLWETEDHRNWTDANFKTYSTPIALGRPAPLEAGQERRQRLVITPVDVPAGAGSEGAVRLSVGEPTGTRVPAVGLGQDRDHHRPDARERELLGALSPAHVRVEVRLDRDDWREALEAAQETAGAIGSRLEVSLHLLEEHAAELPALAAALAGVPPVARVLVINADSRTATPAETTRHGLMDTVRGALVEALPEAAFVGGTEIYFTEINRTRPEHGTWDGICYSITPQIHAFTDVDVVENLDAQAETVRSARAIAGDKAVVVSPITMRRRVNFHAAGDPPPDVPGELPDSVDVRQSSLLGAAWTAGSVMYVAEAGASSVTYYETTGWRGVLERAAGSELPEAFRSAAGEVFPLYHPLADATEWKGAEVLACESSDVLAAVGLAVRTPDGGTRLLVANLAPREQDVVIAPVSGPLGLRRLNESTAAEAAADPTAFRRHSEGGEAAGELELRLAPYEVVRVDPA